MTAVAYPSFARRYFGMLIDVLTMLFIVGAIIKSGWIIVDLNSGFLLFVLLAATYDPLLTIYGATLGQFLMRFRMRNRSDGRRISILHGYLRFAIKSTLGALSLVTVATRKDRRTLHDMAAETIALNAGDAAIHASVPR